MGALVSLSTGLLLIPPSHSPLRSLSHPMSIPNPHVSSKLSPRLQNPFWLPCPCPRLTSNIQHPTRHCSGSSSRNCPSLSLRTLGAQAGKLQRSQVYLAGDDPQGTAGKMASKLHLERRLRKTAFLTHTMGALTTRFPSRRLTQLL